MSIKYYLLTILLILIVTLIGAALHPFINLVNIALTYLLPIIISAVRWGRGPSLFAAVLSVLVLNYCFVSPAFGLIPNDPQGYLVLFVFTLVAIVTGTIATRLRNEREGFRALASHLQSVREEERTRVAREIHDELGQALTGLKMELSLLSKKIPETHETLTDDIHSMEKLVDDTIQTVRNISAELRPGVLDDIGLVSAIEWQVEYLKNRTEIQFDFSSFLEDGDINHDLATTLFRILQEALTNIVRHAQATHVKIDLKEVGGFIILTVEDDGIGITEREAFNPKSFGLQGVKERALILGGTVQIRGSKEKGTTIDVKIPFKKGEKRHA